jgi:hypothetical protein
LPDSVGTISGLLLDPKQYPVQYGVKRQIWVENLDSVEEKKLALLDLHPDIFSGITSVLFYGYSFIVVAY